MAVIANFSNGSTKAFTSSIYQHSKGQRVVIEGITLPEHCEMHFSNEEQGGLSIPALIQNGSALIPDGFLATGKYVYGWLYAEVPHDEEPTPEPEPDPNASEDPSEGEEEEEEGGSEEEPMIEATDIQTLYEVVIPVIQRPAVVRPHYPTDGEGMFAEQYTVEGENLIFIKK